jgi:hypothetical protein
MNPGRGSKRKGRGKSSTDWLSSRSVGRKGKKGNHSTHICKELISFLKKERNRGVGDKAVEFVQD